MNAASCGVKMEELLLMDELLEQIGSIVAGVRKKGMKRISLGVGGVVGLLYLVSHIYTVPSGYVGVVKNWGAASDTVTESGGLHFQIPVKQTVSMVSTQPLTIQSAESASTHDLQTVSTNVAVTFHIAPG